MSRLCCAEIHIADSYGDNSALMYCQLPEGHGGAHRYEFLRGGKPVVVTFEVDEFEEERRLALEQIAEFEPLLGMTMDEFLQRCAAGEIGRHDKFGEWDADTIEWIVTKQREADAAHEKRKNGIEVNE